VRVAPIFRDVTDADVADILAFVDENMPWMRPELDRLRTTNTDQFRQVCRHLRYEVAQLKDLKGHDPEGFRKAIEEKQLRFRAQDLANKARAATDAAERDALSQELRKVLDRLFDVEMATREAQIAQLEGRMDALREELKARAANRQKIVATRLDDMLKGKKETDRKYRPDSRSSEKDKGDHRDKSEKSERGGDRGDKGGGDHK
jgi:DNA anti-recombination protein RmuC